MWISRESSRGLLVGVLIAGLLINFRWLSLPILAIALVASSLPRLKTNLVRIAWCGVLFSLIGPVDIDPFNYRMHHGESEPGMRLVRLVYGIPMHVTLLEKYGEYFSGGCFVPAVPARWILTWKKYPNEGMTLKEIREQLDDARN